MTLPRLHVVTSDAVLATPDFVDGARALLDALGPAVALHLRARQLTARAFHDLAADVAVAAFQSGAMLLINERVDLALATRSGAHLNERSVPLLEARRLLHNAPLGYSAHTLEDALLAEVEGADFVFLGSIYRTDSHPDGTPAGVSLLERVVPRLGVPAIAIGGITPERVPEVRAAGAWGIAAIRGIWDTEDPLAAARAYLGRLHE